MGRMCWKIPEDLMQHIHKIKQERWTGQTDGDPALVSSLICQTSEVADYFHTVSWLKYTDFKSWIKSADSQGTWSSLINWENKVMGRVTKTEKAMGEGERRGSHSISNFLISHKSARPLGPELCAVVILDHMVPINCEILKPINFCCLYHNHHSELHHMSSYANACVNVWLHAVCVCANAFTRIHKFLYLQILNVQAMFK